MGVTTRVFKHQYMIVIFSAFLLLYGCAGVAPVTVEPIPSTESPMEHLTLLKKNLDEGHSARLNILAPDSFAEATRYYESAKTGIDEGGNIAAIMDSIANGRAYLERARESSKLSLTAMPELLEERENARAAGAPALEKEYAEVEERFLELTRAVEANDMKTVQRRKEAVAEAYHDVKLKAIKTRYIGEIRDLIARAENDGAKKYAPATLESAKAALAEADAFISEHPYEKEAMIEKASAALFEAQRLSNINRHNQQIRGMEPEQITLSTEGMLHRITAQIAAPDMRNEPFEMQVDNIVGSTAAIQDDRRFLAETVKELQAEAATLKQEHFDEIQKLKAANQAELNALDKRYKDEMAATGKKHLAEVLTMTERIAALEGKSRGEQNEIARLETEKRAIEERIKAEKQAELDKFNAEKQAAQARFEAEKQAAQDKLDAEKRFNSLYVEMQNLFDKDEAEVYRKGSQLVIRLKEMRFPVGKAVIMPENYPLLSKVQRAIRTFANPTIVIEGHTDSTGPDTLNDFLSQQRSDAVREYFLANNAVAGESILAVGYGSKNPLASNETVEGRAMNRRIDVLITPGNAGAQ